MKWYLTLVQHIGTQLAIIPMATVSLTINNVMYILIDVMCVLCSDVVLVLVFGGFGNLRGEMVQNSTLTLVYHPSCISIPFRNFGMRPRES